MNLPKLNYIFDLDHTLIDSSHRQLTDANGSLDLTHWIENCTREKIMGDKLLPLAEQFKRSFFYNSPDRDLLVCTARVMSDFDYEFLAENGLKFDFILSRPEGCTMGDGELKEMLLRKHCEKVGIDFTQFTDNAVMWDDNKTVLDHLKGLGIRMVDAIKLNKALTA